MYTTGRKEIEAIAKTIESGMLFRYNCGKQCERFEKRYGRYLNVKHVIMTSSGTTALTAALAGLGIGPGDEVIVPACTYMATAVSVISVGAIPVIADIDESITLDPAAFENAIGPQTRAVIPVHMWGVPCDMNPIMRIARKHKLLVIEDACQAVGGGYRGKKLGSIGHAGAFSFNYFKNMSCGEGGAVVTRNKRTAQRAGCMIDSCRFYWSGRKNDFVPFIANGSRASEIEGAMMNAQLDRIDGMVRAMRRQKTRILAATSGTAPLTPARANSLDDECGTQVIYLLPKAAQAEQFAADTGGTVLGKTGRHVYTEWDPIFKHQGAHHPALNPFTLPQNRRCRKRYTKAMCAPSVAILNRAVMIPTHPERTRQETTALIRKIRLAADTAVSV